LSTNTAEKKNGIDVAECLGDGESNRNARDLERKM
jgi:hypothetical protein